MRNSALIAFVMAMGSVFRPHLSAQEPLQVPAAQLEIQNALYELYPDIRQRAVYVDQASSGTRVLVRVVDAVTSGDDQRAREPLLSTSIELTQAGAIRSLRSRGALVREGSNRTLARRLRVAADPDALLNDEALPFGPGARARLLGALPIAALRRQSETATVLSAIPVRRPRVYSTPLLVLPEPSDFEPPFYWRVELLVGKPGSVDQIHVLDFEPFEGRPIQMTRRNVQ